MNFRDYIDKIEIKSDFKSSGCNKEMYIDIMDTVFNAYPINELIEMVEAYQCKKIEDIHSFSRLTAALGELIASGRRCEHIDLWYSMMDCCCRDLHRITDTMKLDFAVKEIMVVYKAMEPYVSETKKAEWLNDLRKIEPYINYKAHLDFLEPDKLHNISVFNMTGEYLRETEGLTETTEYFKRHWPVQLQKFDDNGMYKDPNNPILYDAATRYSIQLLMFYGYNGEFKNDLDKYLENAGLYTLFMQSPNFEMPFGGRSNQFLFNDAYVAGICEFEAQRYKAKGDLKTAGMFKRCAHLSMKSVLRWINEAHSPKHIRNFYPIESKHGEEPYAYYDKYMITLAVNAYIAFLFSDDSIEEYPCPQECCGYVFETTNDFHKIFACCKGNYIEIDACADCHYDSTGLGRYHKCGIPSELGLSIPMTKHPEYHISTGMSTDNISICAGWDTGEGEIQYLSDISCDIDYKLNVIKCTDDIVEFSVVYYGSALNGCSAVEERYTLDIEGVHIAARLIEPKFNRIYYRVPLFMSNGKDLGEVTALSDRTVEIKMNDNFLKVEIDGSINVSDKKYANRNGEYAVADILKSNSCGLLLNISLY